MHKILAWVRKILFLNYFEIVHIATIYFIIKNQIEAGWAISLAFISGELLWITLSMHPPKRFQGALGFAMLILHLLQYVIWITIIFNLNYSLMKDGLSHFLPQLIRGVAAWVLLECLGFFWLYWVWKEQVASPDPRDPV